MAARSEQTKEINKNSHVVLFIILGVIIGALVLIYCNFDKLKDCILGFIGEHKDEVVYQEAMQIYREASSSYDLDGLDDARKKLEQIQDMDYRDTREMMEKIPEEIDSIKSYNNGSRYYEDGRYDMAFPCFEKIQGYREVDMMINKMIERVNYESDDYLAKGEFASAIYELDIIPEYLTDEYQKAQKRKKEILQIQKDLETKRMYDKGVEHFAKREYLRAQEMFVKVSDDIDVSEYMNYIGEVFYTSAMDLFTAGDGDYYGCYKKIVKSRIDQKKYWDSYERAVILRDSAVEAYKAEIELEAARRYYENGFGAAKAYLSENICEIYSRNDMEACLTQYETRK